MRFSFIHAADLHIDSPLVGMSLKDRSVAARFAQAGRRAVEALVAETVASRAAFLVIAGDVFDGDWKDVTTGLFFARALGALHRAGIPVFMVKGNHDAESVMSRDLPYPDSVTTFRANRAETVTLDALRVALHGRSFPHRLTGDFVETYPARRDGWLNIGVLHTSLDGSRGHQGYAPCSVEDLKRFGYDYWALGHVHAAEIVHRDPWIVFPGNLQGRSVRETGAKGAMRVTVEDGRIVDVAPIVLDAARWAHPAVDVTAVETEAAVLAAAGEAVAAAHEAAEGRPLAVRVTLSGETPLHNRLVARRETLQDELRAVGFRVADDCWIESLKVGTVPPPATPSLAQDAADEGIDVDRVLAEVVADPEFAGVVDDLASVLKARLPRDLHDAFAQSDARETVLADARAWLSGEPS